MNANLNFPIRKGSAVIVALLVVVVLAVVTAASALYRIDEAEQGIVLQFGQPVGEAVTQPGLHFKLPFIQEVRRFDKRLQSWDGDPNQIPTRGEQFISVDTTARWRIVDPLRFLQRVQNERGAQNRLNDILDSVVRDYVSSSELIEIVRSKDWTVSQEDLERALVAAEEEQELLQQVQTGREELVAAILETAQQQMPQYGIDLVDIRIKRVDYVQDVQERVFERMIAERQRMAEQFRSEGGGRAAEIDGETERLLAQITSVAQRDAEIIRGRADADATRIYNKAFGADPEFYAFFRTLESYPQSLGKEVTMIVGANSDYFRYLRNMVPPDAPGMVTEAADANQAEQLADADDPDDVDR